MKTILILTIDYWQFSYFSTIFNIVIDTTYLHIELIINNNNLFRCIDNVIFIKNSLLKLFCFHSVVSTSCINRENTCILLLKNVKNNMTL